MRAKCFILVLVIIVISTGFTLSKAAELKIGYTGPLSGGGVSWGYASLAGLELAMDEINKAGGLKVGGTVYTLKSVPYDSKFLPDPAVTAAKRLIFEDKVKFIFGEIGASPVLAIQGITEPNKVIFFPNSYGHRTLGPDKPFSFRWSVTNVEFTAPHLEYYRKRWREAKRLAYLCPDDETGRSMVDWQKKFGPQYGFEVIGFSWERGMADLTPVIMKALAANVDIMDLDGSPPGEAGQLVNILRDMGWSKPIVKTGGAVAYDLIRICGKKANGVVYHEDADFAHPKVAALIERFKAKGYPAAPNTLMIPAYDGAMLLFKAIQKAGTVEDTEMIKKAIEDFGPFEGLHGSKARLSGKEVYGINRQLMNVVFIGEIINDKPTIIEKIEFK